MFVFCLLSFFALCICCSRLCALSGILLFACWCFTIRFYVLVCLCLFVEFLVSSIEQVVADYGLSESFIGVILLPIVGSSVCMPHAAFNLFTIAWLGLYAFVHIPSYSVQLLCWTACCLFRSWISAEAAAFVGALLCFFLWVCLFSCCCFSFCLLPFIWYLSFSLSSIYLLPLHSSSACCSLFAITAGQQHIMHIMYAPIYIYICMYVYKVFL